MSQNSGGITPLDWRALVAEALRRRKAERLTQRQHAALASVSIPTIVAFDRGELTLSLAKAFDILRVVGLMQEAAGQGTQERFVQEASARWRELVAPLPKDSPGRFPHGWYRFDYALEGELKDVELRKFHDILKKAEPRLTGWPVLWGSAPERFAPYEKDGVLECWLAPGDDRPVYEAAHCDFWRASPAGRMFLIRGYQEDTQETFPPHTVFDTGLPIWRIGAALLHAARLSALLKHNDHAPITVKFRAYYTGLAGRVLRAWANPLSDFIIEGGAARSDEAVLEVSVADTDIAQRLADHIYPLAASLYERFGVTGLSLGRVQAEVERFKRVEGRNG